MLCPDCLHNLPRISPPVCSKCGKPESNRFCSSCSGRIIAIDGIRSVFRFDGVVRQAIYQLKYHNLREIAPVMFQFLAEYMNFHPFDGDALVPVPLHNRRLRERGYNQSGLLAMGLGRLVNLPVVENTLIRIKNSQPQARTVKAEQRKVNVQDAFTCCNDKLNSKHVILIDDVTTSGATLESCASALKEKGAMSVWGLTLAREI